MLGKDIEDLVIIKLEEYSPFKPSDDDEGALLSGGDVLDEIKPVYSYVHKSLPEAANEILLVLPLNKVPFVSVDDDDITYEADDDDERIGTITEPDDFLRLHTLKLKTWVKAVHRTINPEDDAYTLQQSEWTRGTYTKPMVVRDRPYLRYYSLSDSAAGNIIPCTFKYITKFNPFGDYTRDVAEAIAINCAKKVLEVYGSTEQVTIMSNELNATLENMKL